MRISDWSSDVCSSDLAEGSIIGGLVYVGALAAVGAVVATGGTLLAGLAGAALAGSAGGLIGSVLAKRLGEHRAQYLLAQSVRGGSVLWVRTRDPTREQRAIEHRRQPSAHTRHVHMPPHK